MDDAHAEQFFESLEESITDGSFVKLTLAKCRGRDADLKNLYVRPVALKKGARLSFLFRHRTKDVVKNHTAEEGVRLIRKLLGAEFLSGHLFTHLSERLELAIRRRVNIRRRSVAADEAFSRILDAVALIDLRLLRRLPNASTMLLVLRKS